MFPLGSVLLRSMLMPLRIFEPRYREMITNCLEGDHHFGVVLIERGSEVGGGDVRSDVATLADIVQAEPFGAGEWFVVVRGGPRIRVLEWLPDDPYPRARVQLWPDEPSVPSPEVLDQLLVRFGEVRALMTRLGHEIGPLPTVAGDEPSSAVDLVAAAAPVGPFDRQRLLVAPDAARRAEVLGEVLDDVVLLLRAQVEEL